MTRRILLSLIAAAPAFSSSKLDTPSLSTSVIVNGKVVRSEAIGLADIENGVPATTKSVYRYASISKPITAAAVLSLAQEGLLDLDAPQKQWKLKWPVTARQLLGQLGGIRHYSGRSEALNTTFYSTLARAVDGALTGDPQFFAPGTKYLYSTRGYTLLGALAEQASGLAFRDLIRTYVFGPAGMTNARVDHAYELIPNRVRGYFRSQNGDIRNAEFQDTSAILPGGGLCGTAEDLARFGAAVMNRAILNPRTVASMWTPQRTIDGGETGYGLGWYVAGSGASLRVWHGGAQSGARGLLLLYPPQNAGVALLTNIEQVDLRPTARALVEEHGLTWSQM